LADLHIPGRLPVLFLLISLAFLLQPVLAGNTLTVTGEIASPSPLRADFSASPATGPSPLTVQFTDASIGVVTVRVWEYRWNGGPWRQFASSKNPSFTFRSPGTYDIRLTVTGPAGSDDEVKAGYITVLEPVFRPVARFAQDRNIGNAPLTVHFTDRSLNNPASYVWQFGDGSTSGEENPSHTYTRPGVYLVRLRVSNSTGSDTATSIVVVLPGWWR